MLNVVQHGSYSNYNGMVAALQKQMGRATFLVNYTWSKVMGIRDGQSDNGNGDGAMVNPYNLRANYGPLAYDHRNIFNAAYVIHLPGASLQNRLVKEITTGWDLSGDTQVQSGAPIQPNTGGNLNAQWTGSAGNNFYLGTPSEPLLPYLTCDPRNTRQSGQRFNPGCFETPTTLGVNGPSIWPNITGPKFFVSDLAMAKSFKIHESQNILFRASAFNFLNHALPQFGLGSDVNLQMGCNSTTIGTTTPTCNAGGSNTNNGFRGTTGVPAYETGRRVIEVALKYNF